jgi:CDP-diacylglycerol--serine O-phosphatidyltransferase
MLKHLPNFLTCCNLLCGCIGIVFLLEGRGIPAAYFVWISGIFDFFDGFVARLVKANSPIGKELDSLADVVSFGVLPSVLLYQLLQNSTTSEILPFIAFSIAAFAAMRLAIFNLDETQSDSFKGLNTPAATLFLTGLPFLPSTITTYIFQPWALVALIIGLCLLMVSRIEFFALKFKNFSWASNKIRYIFLLISVALLIILQTAAISPIILLYFLLSLLTIKNNVTQHV